MRTFTRLFIAGFVILGIAVLVWFAGRYQQARAGNTEVATVNARLILYCIRYRFSLSLDEAVCSDQWWEDSQTDSILTCHRLSPALEPPFNECLQQEGISPPSE